MIWYTDKNSFISAASLSGVPWNWRLVKEFVCLRFSIRWVLVHHWWGSHEWSCSTLAVMSMLVWLTLPFYNFCCWIKALLPVPACPCWRQGTHSDGEQNLRVLSVVITQSPYLYCLDRPKDNNLMRGKAQPVPARRKPACKIQSFTGPKFTKHFNRRRLIIGGVSANIRVAILPSFVEYQRTE